MFHLLEKSISDEWEDGNVASAFNRFRQQALMG
jgi:hypothetical protein